MNAIIYSRVSTLDQDNERAIEELTGYAKYRKFKVLKVFEEKISGAVNAKDRTEFSKVLEFIEKNKVDQLLIWELSRLGRSMVDVINTIEYLSKKKINVFCKKEGFNTLNDKGEKDWMTNILISVLSGFAEMERETIKARSKSGIRAAVSRGKIGTGGVKAYGFTRDENGMLVIDQNEIKVVHEIYDKYVNGLGTQQIAQYLNNKGVPTKFNKEYGNQEVKQKKSKLTKKGIDYVWRDATVYNILTNRIYIGERIHKGEVFTITPTIDKGLFEKVQEMLSKKSNKIDSTVRHYNPLKDLLICGKCGQSYFLHKRSDGEDNAYKCLSIRQQSKKYGDNYCGNPAVNYDKLINSIHIVTSNLIYSDLVDKKDVLSTVEKTIENKQIEKANTVKEIESIEKEIENLTRLNIKGKLTDKVFSKLNTEFNDKLSELTKRLKNITNSLLNLESQKKNKQEFDYTKESLGTYLKEVVEYIKIYEVEIEKFRNVYPKWGSNAKLDALMLIQVKATLEWKDGTPIFYHYLISRRSNIISFVDIPLKKMEETISKSKFKIDFHTEIDKMKPIKGIKNYWLKKKDEPFIEPPEYALKPVFENRKKK